MFKQARAFGVGVVLSTQNPVDLDYKAISNAGTWMIGRLQTERDKSRLLDGMSSAAGSVDLSALSETISGLGKRQFLMQRTGGSAPKRFGVRWAMSYLAGPLSKDQVGLLPGQADGAAALAAQSVAASPGATSPAAAPSPSPDELPSPPPEVAAPVAAQPVASAAPTPGTSSLADDETPTMPEVAEGTPVRFLDPAAPWAADIGSTAGGPRLEPAVVARVQLLYDEGDFRSEETYEAVFFPLSTDPAPESARVVDYDDRDLTEVAPAGAAFALPDAKVATKAYFTTLQRALTDHLYRSRSTELFTNPTLKLAARPNETREEFEARAKGVAEADADLEANELRKKLAVKADRIRATMAKDQERLSSAETTASTSKTDELISGAGSVFGALMGGRRSSSPSQPPCVRSPPNGVAAPRQRRRWSSTRRVSKTTRRVSASSRPTWPMPSSRSTSGGLRSPPGPRCSRCRWRRTTSTSRSWRWSGCRPLAEQPRGGARASVASAVGTRTPRLPAGNFVALDCSHAGLHPSARRHQLPPRPRA